ncbi:unnamed protein product [Rhizophagus irregularis]|uniref:Protein kinase domain-containing protein n=1 Tax=Rhizophagus irregularis TaxID=588596 RepID=A0A2I1HIG8_9GLOM|nr:hypothetical protein RhiirA4_480712 [Rhizophagus irregularis]CAB4435268.1 unnamed protein product [Rhizophagus irregularis]
MTSIFKDINNLPIDDKEKVYLLNFFTNRDTAKVGEVLSTIVKNEMKANYLREHVKSLREREEEKRKIREMEIKYEEEKNKRRHCEVLLDATNHSLSRLWETYNPTRDGVLWFEPSGRSLSFDSPPTNDKESFYQTYFTTNIITQLDNDFVIAVDTHGKKFLDGKAPDVCTHSKGYSLTQHTVEVIGEIKPLGSCFTPINKGQVLQYATIALKHQKNVRKEITGLPVQLDNLIASTTNSTIFSIVNDKSCVVKIVKNNYCLENEIRILNELQHYVSDEGIIKLINSSTTAIQLRPRAIQSFKESREPISRLAEIVDKLRICHQFKLVHCDVRLTNILVCNDKLILADFGCALHEGKYWNGCGPTLPFRSLRLMEAKEQTIKCQDDLFTLTQSIYIHLNEEKVIEADINSPNKVDEAIKFWRKVFEEGIWRDMFISCNNLDYDNLKRYINELV